MGGREGEEGGEGCNVEGNLVESMIDMDENTSPPEKQRNRAPPEANTICKCDEAAA